MDLFSLLLRVLLYYLQVLFGTADGQVIVMDCHGRMLAHVLLHESDGILSMSWNYPSFLVEDSSESDTDSDDYSPPQGSDAFSFVPLNICYPFKNSNAMGHSCSVGGLLWFQSLKGAVTSAKRRCLGLCELSVFMLQMTHASVQLPQLPVEAKK